MKYSKCFIRNITQRIRGENSCACKFYATILVTWLTLYTEITVFSNLDNLCYILASFDDPFLSAILFSKDKLFIV